MIGYLPVDERDAVDRRLAYDVRPARLGQGPQGLPGLARQLDAKHPDAA